MKIAYVIINANQREGTARAVVEVAESLSKNNEVHLFARTVEEVDLSMIRWHHVPGISRPEVASFTTFFSFCSRMARRENFSIIHSAGCNTSSANVYTIQNVQNAKVKILNRLAGEERVSVARRFSRWMYLRVTCRAERWIYARRKGRRPPLFLPVSRGTEAELRAHHDIGDAPVRVIPNAANAGKFKPLDASERSQWRRENGIAANAFLTIFAGGEWARKGLDLAIKALALVADANVLLFVAGDDPGRARFQKLASDLGLSGRVIFAGFRKDLPRALGAADLFLFPSWYEAFSLAVIEAAACGLPIVSTRVNGTEDFIQPGINGEFIDHDPARIAAVLNSLVSAPRPALDAMGRAARRLVEANYTWQRVAQMTENAYEEYFAHQDIGGHA